ncbi:hypothetical protein D1BOALGB6SA_2231 [Olavius sp. associated proteobacterium Delta 1]|nr:hypothetical protein D1BOALGB6SA_2231 [Olavius sp. associated proteobacterium Delta 1]
MQNKFIARLLLIGLVLWGLTAGFDSIAQETEYILAHQDIFGRLRRPQVNFSHEIHSDTLEDEGCGVCHHVQDDRSGKLVYIEGEELSCKECHVQRKENQIPALREAYHGNCTVCHRQLIKAGKPKTGPTTCGGCHIKQ